MRMPLKAIKAMIAAALLAGYAADAAELVAPMASVTVTESEMPPGETLPPDDGAEAAAALVKQILEGN